MATPSSALRAPLHPDVLVVVELGGALLRPADAASASTRIAYFGARTPPSDRRVRRRSQSARQTLQVDQGGRRDSRPRCSVSPRGSYRRTALDGFARNQGSGD